MTIRDEVTILQQAVQKGIEQGYLRGGPRILGCDFTTDPPSICVHRESRYATDDTGVYLDPLFPLLERDWAIAFWGNEMMPSQTYVVLPAWKYHQHRLLEFVQNEEMEEFYKYIQIFL